jgi:hypothetical protein
MEPSKGGVNMEQAVKLGFNLIDFLADYGYFTQAEVIMTVLLMVLNKSQNMDTWMSKCRGYIEPNDETTSMFKFTSESSRFLRYLKYKW